MSDLIDREAVEQMLREMLPNNMLPALVDELRSLPVAVPPYRIKGGQCTRDHIEPHDTSLTRREKIAILDGVRVTLQLGDALSEIERLKSELARGTCACAETSIRNCPVHQNGDDQPAAVPVCDVENAANALYLSRKSVVEASSFEVLHPHMRELYRRDARAILSAGYVGSVSVEDIRIMCSPLATTEEHMDARKRLLAATEGK